MKHEPKGREERETARDRDPRTREQRRAVPTAGEVFAKQHVETRHVEKNGTQCFKSGSNDNWENKSAQDESNVIINTDEADQSKKQDGTDVEKTSADGGWWRT